MKFLATVVGLFFFITTYGQLVVNDPNAELRSVSPFSTIKVSGGIEVLLTKADKVAVAVSNGKSGNNADIKTEVKNGVLEIYPNAEFMRLRNRGVMRVYVAYTSLSSLIATGASEVTFADLLKADKLSMTLSGASEVKGKVEADRLSVSLSGASDARLSGNIKDLQLFCSGASDFKSYDLVTESCTAKIEGASDSRVTVSQSLSVKASGASSFYFKGTPARTEIEKSGSSEVSNKN